MEYQKNKIIIAWIVMIILIGSTLFLTCLKFFTVDNGNIEERPINESSSNAVHAALNDITVNFNQSDKVKKYFEEDNIILKATVNNYSIYISYITDTTTTYEFNYDSFWLNTTVSKDNKEKFYIVYRILIEAVQKRINNTDNIDLLIDDFLNKDINYEGLIKKEVQNGIEYKINITKKIKLN